MSIKAGDKIPAITLKHKSENGIQDITTEELFSDKKVVLFAVPGAFTPTCSAKHLPGFITKAEEIKAKGVDTIACISVNDAFVMDAWGNDQSAGDKVMMLADGSATFTKAIGQELDRTEAGMGIRSTRYAMIVNDGVVIEMLAEEPGAFEVSSAEFVLGKL
ncbi:MAG: peroxiredoxin [Rhodospirillaceae bacterium]|nr:peroxiredoxin [Rhodospirillaceae bacterium]|tara:strand:+ start:5349 stop:5831 length:483 start_codon:yes stop_codon:yes gene_type:complete